MPPTPQLLASRLAEAAEANVVLTADPVQLHHSPAPSKTPVPEEPIKEYISKIGILASSVPYYHNQYMEKRRENNRNNEGSQPDLNELALVSDFSLDGPPQEQSTEEQAATVRRLKPHSRSTVQLQNITASVNPDVNAQGEKKRTKPTKWQFGIRGRNGPLDAMHCIFKALKAHGAQWQVPRPEPVIRLGPIPYRSRVHRDHHDYDREYGTEENRHDHGSFSVGSPPRYYHDHDREVDPDVFPNGYLPKDPWYIHARWRKTSMAPSGPTQPPLTGGSVRSDEREQQARKREQHAREWEQQARERLARRRSVAGHTTSASGSTIAATDSCYVYMDVQLYMLEQDCYLVDFKCAGYETIMEEIVGESERSLIGSGFRVASKDVTSPQPFMDFANKLIILLARGS